MKPLNSKYIVFILLALIFISGIVAYLANFSFKNTPPSATNEPHSIISPLSAVSPINPNFTVAVTTSNATSAQDFQEGLILYDQGDYQPAIEIFSMIINASPKDFLAYEARGNCYVALKEYNQALDDFAKAIELAPNYPYAYYNRGRVYIVLDDYDKALSDMQQSLILNPIDFAYQANGNIGLIYHQQAEYDKALEAFAAAISFDDSKADTYYLRGETYTAMSNYEAAISDYEAAISRFSKYNQAYQNLGYARYKTGQFDQALEALNKALELSPGTPTPYFYRMLVYLATDQADKTQAEVTQGMETIGALSEEEQALLFKRILEDLETFAQENPAQAKAVEALVNLIPPQQS